MRKYIYIIICLLGLVFTKTQAQDKEFWFVAPDVAYTHSDRPVFFVFSNPNKAYDATVKMEFYNGGTLHTETYTVPAKGYKKVDYVNPNSPVNIENLAMYAGSVNNFGIHITSNIGILAYYMVNGGTQRDVYTLKGKPALGTAFYTPFESHEGEYFEQRSSNSYKMGTDQIDIVASEDNTSVTVNLTKNCMYGGGDGIHSKGQKMPAGTYTFTMNKGQTLELREDTVGINTSAAAITAKKNEGTLAGTYITSTKPIAVTQTEDCLSAVSFSRKSTSTDVVGDQLVPVDKVGKNYVVVRGHSTVGERVDFTATKANTTITVYYFDYFNNEKQLTKTLTNAGDNWYVDMTRLGYEKSSSDIFVKATEPIYCFQHSATLGELGGALIPSMYSISQQQIAFYCSDGQANDIVLVFRKGKEGSFKISYGSVSEQPMTITPLTLPSSSAGDWNYANISLTSKYPGAAQKMVVIENEESAFSLGYFNGVGTSTAGYGYFSGYGDFKFDADTFFKCPADTVVLQAGYAASYKWHTPNGSILTTQEIKAGDAGQYILEMDQDPIIIKDTCVVEDVYFNAVINPLANAILYTNTPYTFSATVNPNLMGSYWTGVHYSWVFNGGTPATSDEATPTVIFSTPGTDKVQMGLSSVPNTTPLGGCDTTLNIKVYGIPAKTKKAKLNDDDVKNGTLGNPVEVLYGDVIQYGITAVDFELPITSPVIIRDTIPAYLKLVDNSITTGSNASNTYTYNSSNGAIEWKLYMNADDMDSVYFKATPVDGSCASQPLWSNTGYVTSGPLGNITYNTNSTYHQGGGIAIVTFSSTYGGTIYNDEPQAVDFSTTARSGVLAVADKGYKFTGWSYSEYVALKSDTVPAQNGIMKYDSIKVYGDVTLNANFEKIEYPITYYLNGGVAEDNPVMYDVDTKTFTLKEPKKAGDVFIGWTGTSAETPQKNVEIEQGTTGSLTYFANFLYSGNEVANAPVENNTESIWASKGEIHISGKLGETIVRIYDTSGVLCKQEKYTGGTTTIAMPHGTYIVTLNGEAGYKVAVK